MPAPSSYISIITWPPSQQALDRLALRDPLLRRFDAVIDRVAHDMREWIFDRLEDRTVEAGFGPFELEPHMLAELAR
jgi:hypothetical protein